MAIIVLKAWYLEQYKPIREVIKQPHDLRLSRNSLLKSGLRADFLDARQDVETSTWFERYLQGETIEFYIEGSGTYIISNVDLVSQEIYLTKKEVMAGLDPVIFFSRQTEYPTAHEASIEALNQAIEQINQRSRLPLSLELSSRPEDYSLRLSDSQLRKIRKSLLFVADVTAIASIEKEKQTSLLLSSNVCVEIGYALRNKDIGQMLFLRLERSALSGDLPFDVSGYKQLEYKTAAGLQKSLPKALESLLQKFSLF